MSTDVLLLHGLGADARAFQRFLRLLPPEWNAHAIDLLGHGVGPHPDHGYGLEDHANHVARRIDELGLSHPVLVGHSYGAAVSVVLAATRPLVPQALVLLDPIEYDPERGGRTEQMMQARRDGRMREAVERLFADASPALQRWTIETWEQMALGVVEEIDHDWMRYAHLVTCPVAVIHGDEEHGGGGPDPAANFAAPLVVRIGGAGHYLHATHARETAAAVADAVAELVA